MDTHPRVLIVDDEDSLRRQLMVGLKQHGYQVDGCEEGLPALSKIEAARSERSPFGLVILDVRLPDIDGLKILSILKTAYPELPILVITGYGTEDTVNTVQSRGGNAYLDKPFDMEALVDELDRLAPKKMEKPLPKIAPEPQVLSSAFVLIRGGKDADLPALYSKLSYAEGVCYCDPVVGDWDIVLLVQGADLSGIERLVQQQIASLPGVEAFEVHYCEKPKISAELAEFIRDYERALAMEGTSGPMDKRKVRMFTAYAILDVDPVKLPNLYVKLYFTNNVVHCDVTDGGKQVTLLLQGISEQEIQSTIRGEIRFLPGVLRIKQLNVLNFAIK